MDSKDDPVMTRFAVRSMVLTLLVTAGYNPPVSAQGEEPTNLQVLPENTSRRELRGIMDRFTEALDVECTYCHVEAVPGDRSTRHYAADEKRTKQTAREMLQMVEAINDRLTSLPDRQSPEVEVNCATCHAGKQRPTSLEQEITWAFEKGGLDAAKAHYGELRDEYFGRNAYDFGPAPLDAVASELMRAEPQAALQLIEMNLEYHPQAAQSWYLKGRIHGSLDQTDEAITAIERALEIQPNIRGAGNLLDRLRGGDYW